MIPMKYTKGDATNPVGERNRIIAHICNDIGGWGKGFVLAISKKWKDPENQYRDWFESQDEFDLGKVQFVKVQENIWIANMIAQHKIRRGSNGRPPIRYDSLKVALETVATKAMNLDASIHMPRIGCGLAGGKWGLIEPIIHESCSKKIYRWLCMTLRPNFVTALHHHFIRLFI